MPKKYNIPIQTAPPRFNPVGKYTTVEFRENCAGSCLGCVKKKCVYDIFKEGQKHISTMDEPEYLYTCMSCFRCVQECTKGIFSRVVNPEYRRLGNSYWRADIIHGLWYQAHTGKVPVSGAGYRGPFIGPGFDSMWTDMSEIVRPTRDGIHGREYINTSIELSRRLPRLAFNQDMTIASELPPILEIAVPFVFRKPDFGVLSRQVLRSMALAASRLGTMLIIQPDDYAEDLQPYATNLVPCLEKDSYRKHREIIQNSRMVELAYAPGIEKEFPALRALRPDMIISVGLPLNNKAAGAAVDLTRANVDTIHFYADACGNERDAENPRFLKDMIREIHLELVERMLRQKVKLVFSGGIAMAEHMAKAIICGADAVAVDLPMLVALECRLCSRCREGHSCPVSIGDADPEWGCQRIMNLMGAWRNQLLEVMGAMGIREARRLRGEVGRSLWFQDLEKESFGPIFGQRKVQQT